MRAREVVGVALVCLTLGAALMNRAYGDRVPRAEVARMLAEHDSSVALVLSQRDLEREVGDALRAEIKDLGDVEVVTRLVIIRDTVRVTDTLSIETLVPADALPTDTVDLDLGDWHDSGITVVESVRISPPPRFYVRELAVSFDADTLALALVRDEFGIARILAASQTEGVDVRAIFAAEVGAKSSFLGEVFGLAKIASCAAAGWAAAKSQLEVLAGSGAVCLAGLIW